VLAASLRDGGTSKKIAVIVPADEAHRLLPQTITQLEVLALSILYISVTYHLYRTLSTLLYQCQLLPLATFQTSDF
jgi:hypothetical protein